MEGKRRVGVDSNILVSGILSEWGAASGESCEERSNHTTAFKGVLILAATRVFTLVLPKPVVSEVSIALAETAKGQAALSRLLSLCRPERQKAPQLDEIIDVRRFLPLLRHSNDLPVLASVLKARPDWFLSDNTDHFGPELAEATGLNIL